MKKFGKVALCLSCVALLAGCAKTVTYDDFHKAATAVETNPYTTAHMTGTVKSSSSDTTSETKIDSTFTYSSSLWQAKELVSKDSVYAILLNTNIAASVGNSDSITYYTGNGFKVVYKDTTTDSDTGKTTTNYTGTWEWNEYGYLTSINGNAESSKYNIKVSYSK